MLFFINVFIIPHYVVLYSLTSIWNGRAIRTWIHTTAGTGSFKSTMNWFFPQTKKLKWIIVTSARLGPCSPRCRKQTQLDLFKTQKWHFTNFNGITSIIFLHGLKENVWTIIISPLHRRVDAGRRFSVGIKRSNLDFRFHFGAKEKVLQSALNESSDVMCHKITQTNLCNLL